MKVFCLFVFILIMLVYVFVINKKPESFRNIEPNISIDKYILKSQISQETTIFSDDKYILKTDIPPSIEHIDRDKYILKSEIPTCPHIDLSKYILKSSLKSYRTFEQTRSDSITNQSDSITNQPDVDFGLEAYDSTNNMAQLEEQDNNLDKYIKTCNTNEWNMNNNHAY